MLVLQANQDLEKTFRKLIQTMGAPVAWDGRFIAIGNQLILEGNIRSLVLQFDSKRVTTDLLELTIDESKSLEISEHPKLQDLINMTLYAFGKWGTLKGLRVDQGYSSLNQLFAKILQSYYIEPVFQTSNLQFYKDHMRITYEEVLETALQSEEKPEDEIEEEAEVRGLWHSLIWKNR